MFRKYVALSAAAACLFTLTSCGTAQKAEQTTDSSPAASDSHSLILSDSDITFNGDTVTEETSAVTVTNDIVYYWAGMGNDCGEGETADEHTEKEADAHIVVTIREVGTYRVSGTLSAGQLAIDLGDEARQNPEAVVTLILDNANITCSVAPALIFYNVYECDTNWVAYDEEEVEEYTSSPIVDTTSAGANVILADDSDNHVSGACVARIYKNEGLDSELHLTINGGIIQISAENDGINTNEDNVSVTTINGGTVQVNAGLGVEGDGIDSNGHLVINGGTVYTMSNDRSPNGGIDADGDILIHGGFILAQGTRNDAVSKQSEQKFMELSFASTLPSGSKLELTDPNSVVMFAQTTDKADQSITFSSPDLEYDVSYQLTVDDVVQQYTGTFSGGFGPMGGHPFNGQFSEEKPRPDKEHFSEEMDQLQPNITDFSGRWDGEPPERPKFENGMESRPFGDERQPKLEFGQGTVGLDEPSEEFTLSEQVHTFSGITDSKKASGKVTVSFSAEVITEGGSLTIGNISADADIDPSQVQLTIVDEPSEDYSASCLWSDGEDAIQGLLPDEPGFYRLTIAVTRSEEYTGSIQIPFMIPEQPDK